MDHRASDTGADAHRDQATTSAPRGLHRFCLFSGLDAEEGHTCEHRNCLPETKATPIPKRTVVALAGTRPESVIVVLSGVLKLSTSLRDGRTQIVGLRFAGDIVTTRSPDMPWFATVQVVEDARLCMVDAARINALRVGNSRFQAQWDAHANREIAIAHEHLLTLGRRAPAERLASFLKELSDRGFQDEGGAKEIHIPISRHEIGDYLGLQSETVSRQFTRLKEAGFIELLSPSRVVVNDWENLVHLIEGSHVLAAE